MRRGDHPLSALDFGDRTVASPADARRAFVLLHRAARASRPFEL